MIRRAHGTFWREQLTGEPYRPIDAVQCDLKWPSGWTAVGSNKALKSLWRPSTESFNLMLGEAFLSSRGCCTYSRFSTVRPNGSHRVTVSFQQSGPASTFLIFHDGLIMAALWIVIQKRLSLPCLGSLMKNDQIFLLIFFIILSLCCSNRALSQLQRN